jgi:type IV fimbrial biogenesis protein FimT
MKKDAGFTLIELLIVIAVAGILAAIVIPNFLAYREAARIRGAAGNLRADFEMAKLRAIKENTMVGMEFNADSYLVFVDLNDNDVLDAGEQVLSNPTYPPGVTMSATTFPASRMEFNPRGVPNGAAGTVSLVNTAGAQVNVIVSTFGRIRSE